MDNSIGAVNFLINEADLDTIVQKSEIDYLDIIPSGPTPPNPSELLMGERLDHLIDLLQEKYDYIIIDSPPMGLVSDSLELSKHADATLYLVRQNYTHKNMLTFVNEKYKTGEVKHISILLNEYVEKSGKGYGMATAMVTATVMETLINPMAMAITNQLKNLRSRKKLERFSEKN